MGQTRLGPGSCFPGPSNPVGGNRQSPCTQWKSWSDHREGCREAYHEDDVEGRPGKAPSGVTWLKHEGWILITRQSGVVSGDPKQKREPSPMVRGVEGVDKVGVLASTISMVPGKKGNFPFEARSSSQGP